MLGREKVGQLTIQRSGQVAAEKAQVVADAKTTLLLTQVRTYLPSVNRASGPRSSDHMVHPTALAHLRRRSGFVNDLLRNDSLLDMSKRGDLYRSLFEWLKVSSAFTGCKCASWTMGICDSILIRDCIQSRVTREHVGDAPNATWYNRTDPGGA